MEKQPINLLQIAIIFLEESVFSTMYLSFHWS